MHGRNANSGVCVGRCASEGRGVFEGSFSTVDGDSDSEERDRTMVIVRWLSEVRHPELL